MYTALSGIRKDADHKKEMFVCGGDFNAVVGARNEHDNPKHVGMHGLGMENSRGQWLKQWCNLENMAISNTFFPKPEVKKITHTSSMGLLRQIDFILIPKRLKANTIDACSISAVDMGSDHNAVMAQISCRPFIPKRVHQKKHKHVHWKDVNPSQYLVEATRILSRLELDVTLQRRCCQIEKSLLEAASLSELAQQSMGHGQHTNNKNLNMMVEERRALPHGSDDRKTISKKIQKEVAAIRRIERRTKVAEILDKFQGLKHIAGIKGYKKKKLITSMLDENGEEQCDRQRIADIFADFYEKLYASDALRQPLCVSDDGGSIPPFTAKELRCELQKLKTHKCQDGAGLVAEMLKCGGETLVEILCETYNQLLLCNGEAPITWKETIITVLHKSGDERLPANYRPIVIIPILYKLFARLLYARLAPILDAEQCADQAGFRRDYSTVDHLFTFSQLREKSEEYQLSLWCAAIDFKKAFDTIDHNALWEALVHQNVPPMYVRLLQQLYQDQSGRVRTDKLSRPFTIGRGTKQGDPLSSLLFNALLEHIMRKLKPGWHRKQFGIQLGTGDNARLNNLRFADDILILGKSHRQISSMLTDLHNIASQVGLQLHPDKTKILTNATKKTGRGKNDSMEVADMKVTILPLDGCVKYLGRNICMENSQEVELHNRIRAGWAKFMANRSELTSKHYTLNARLKLFDAIVSPTVLYAAGTWTLTKQQEHSLNCTQRKMLRMIFGAGRMRQPSHPQPMQEPDNTSSDSEACSANHTGGQAMEDLEPWDQWIKRVTHKIEELAVKANVQSWVSRTRLAKWRLASRIINQSPERWSFQVLCWSPELAFDGNTSRAHRRQARPKVRWCDDLQKCVQRCDLSTSWEIMAQDADTWEQHADEYCNDDWRQMGVTTLT